MKEPIMAAVSDPQPQNVTSATPTAIVQRPAAEESVEALAARLASEMVAAWAHGEGPSAEEFLALHPELDAHPQAAIRLIYEEVCLRQERGQELRSEDIFRRF